MYCTQHEQEFNEKTQNFHQILTKRASLNWRRWHCYWKREQQQHEPRKHNQYIE